MYNSNIYFLAGQNAVEKAEGSGERRVKLVRPDVDFRDLNLVTAETARTAKNL